VLSKFRKSLLMIVAAVSLVSCATDTGSRKEVEPAAPPAAAQVAPSVPTPEAASAAHAKKPPSLVEPEFVRGTEQITRQAGRSGPSAPEIEGEYTLNFENVEIKDVVKAVLGDMLQLNYSVAPAVQGTMTLHTAHPMTRDGVLPGFEAALRLAGAALVASPHGYDVVPLQDAAHRSGLALPAQIGLAPGFRLELVPLKFVSATEIQHVLEPVSQPGTIVRVDSGRNFVVLAGTEAELANLIETIAIFDVDWLRTQSFGLYPLHYAPAKSVAAELGQVIGAQGPLAGLVRIVPIDRLNAILVVSPRAVYVDEMRSWVERFDRGGDAPESRLYVYHVQNGSAADLAGVLGKVIGQPRSSTTATGVGTVQGAAPGNDSLTPPTGLSTPALLQTSLGAPTGTLAGPANQASNNGEPRITADEANNALLIMATPAQYKLIEEAIDQLDTIPLQVLIEVTVAEVTLTRDLNYGVQSYFKNGPAQTLVAQGTSSSLTLNPTPGGLAFSFTRGTSTNVVLDLLSTITKTKVLSAPTVMVLNNHTASLNVGEQIPVATSSQVSVQSSEAPVVNTIQQQSTGIILKVTPRVNQGGLVQMDLSQQVSIPQSTTTSSIQSPTIQQREIDTTVAVQDGQTVALGGLISDTDTKGTNGVPWLSEMPVVGALFGTKEDNIQRDEIIILVTPHVVRDVESARSVTDELRAKLPLTHVFDAATH
jgi:general secretion pathway protein D